ncbi:MAG: hypothetical protein V4612_07195 [Pseudomonadota bacterium]
MTAIRLAMKLFCEKHFPKIKHHFDLVHDGKEDLVIVLWVWGGAAYFISFFINKLVLWINLILIKWFLSVLVIAYFVWHIFIIRRCSPKKPPLSQEEKERLKKDRFKRFCRKLFLKEPFTKWNPPIVATAIDLYVIVYFLEYLIK